MESSVLETNPLISRDDVAVLHEDLFRWCMSRCGYDRALAEDLMQQTYVEVISGRAQFQGNSSLRTFLFGVAQNLTRSHFRRVAARARLLARSAAFEPVSTTEEHDDGIDSRQLWQAVRELSDRQRDVIELVFCNELTIEEAAGIMQVSVGSARQHYSRAKSALMKKLADFAVSPDDELPRYGASHER